MKDQLKDYRNYLKIERAMSPNTVVSYCSDIQKFALWFGKPLKCAVTEDVAGYISSLASLEKRTQARVLSSLRSFYGWAVLEKHVTDNPCDLVDSPKLGRYLPDVLSVDEVVAVIDSVDITASYGLRDKAMLEMMYGCGLRVSEAVGMKISCLYMDEGFVRVVGKGDKERLVPIGEVAVDAVKAYLAVRPSGADAESDDILSPLKICNLKVRI